MEKYTDVVQFSRDLYLNFLPVFMRPTHLKKLDPPKYIRTAVKALHYFASCFYLKIQEVFAQHADKRIDTDEQFMKYAVPRCLKLIDEDMFHFSFMLVAAFIGLLQYHDRRCLRFMLSGYKCLAAVYFRGFEEKFEHHGGWRGLRKYCEGVVWQVKSIPQPRRKVVFQELIGGGKEGRVKMSEFIKNCDVVDHFELNERENVLLKYDDIAHTMSEWWDGRVEVEGDSPVKATWTVEKSTHTVEMDMVFDTEMGVLEISVQRMKCIEGSHKAKSSKVRMQYPLKSLLDAPIEPGTELKVLLNPEPYDGDAGRRELGVKFLPCLVKRSVSTESDVTSSVEPSPDENKCVDSCASETQVKCTENEHVESAVAVKDAIKGSNLNVVVRNKITIIARLKYQPGGIKISESRSGGDVSKHCKRKSKTGFPYHEKDKPAVLYVNETKQGEERHFCLHNPTFLHVLQFFTDDVTEIGDFDSFDRKASVRLCGRCGYRCYQYSKFLYKKQRDLALTPVMLRWTKARIIRSLSSIKTVFS